MSTSPESLDFEGETHSIAEKHSTLSIKIQKLNASDDNLEDTEKNYKNPTPAINENNKTGFKEVSVLTKVFTAIISGIIAAIISGTIIFAGGSPFIGILVGTIAFLIIDFSLMKSG